MPTSRPAAAARRLICFSHLRWDLVFQRPQHLMTRFARDRDVTYWQEAEEDAEATAPRLALRPVEGRPGLQIAVPVLPPGLTDPQRTLEISRLLDLHLADTPVRDCIFWYYTPMMLAFSRRHLRGTYAIVYDCMDELANFRFAPPQLQVLEDELFSVSDLVFTGGRSLYEAKRERHRSVHLFPSSVDAAHFARARAAPRPVDEPQAGFFGVLDERLDLQLLAATADALPDWRFEVVGPVVKISPDDLPRRPNLSYPGAASYEQLPEVVARWDVALMPFALNEATRFISPTKTPEYLAAGRPVVSTAIVDVERAYGDLAAVSVCVDNADFVSACRAALAMARGSDRSWLEASDARLASQSWDRTQADMDALVGEAASRRSPPPSTGPGARAEYDALVVGAGFAGAVLAERMAAAGRRVLVIDQRSHIAGNAYDGFNEDGLLIHRYGPHIFHTNSAEVFAYLSRFTGWRPYEHRVLADIRGRLVPIPINRTTLNAVFGLDLRTDAEAAAFLAERAEPVERVRTSEDVVVSAIGRELYELFFQGYTRKQWGLDPSELDRSVTARVPTRTSTDDRYFTDTHQAMPDLGYTEMFRRMLDHPNIDVAVSTPFAEVEGRVAYDHLVFTGPVDEFFGHRFGPLPYRSLHFEHRTLDQAQLQPVAVVNHPDPQTPYTRVTEYKHLTGQSHPKTAVTYEFPSAEGAPYYPIPNAEAQALYKRYEALALQRRDVTFVGRLATYRYYNMDQVAAQALAAWRRLEARATPAALADDAA